MTTSVRLGLGLIGIGRPWGHQPSEVPNEKDVLGLLETAYDLGITFFDTAPSYGLSEERLGQFLHRLDQASRDRITVSTKFGDHWSRATQTAYVDHSFEALRSSLDRSLALLGRIDLLQLHKTSPAVLRSEALAQAWEYAEQQGLTTFGASISDRESGKAVCATERYTVVQLPYNVANTAFGEVIDRANEQDKQVLINRPFKMGELMHSDQSADPQTVRIKAFEFILRKPFHGVVLTGTTSPSHLVQNLSAFKAAANQAAHAS